MIGPFSTKIGEDFESTNEREIPKNRLAQIVPLRIVLKAFLESGDNLDCILEYVASLQASNSTVISYIIIGEVWKKILRTGNVHYFESTATIFPHSDVVQRRARTFYRAENRNVQWLQPMAAMRRERQHCHSIR